MHMASTVPAGIKISRQRIVVTGFVRSDVFKKGGIYRFATKRVVCALRDVDSDRTQTQSLPSLQRSPKVREDWTVRCCLERGTLNLVHIALFIVVEDQTESSVT